jgi:hypothetical protein
MDDFVTKPYFGTVTSSEDGTMMIDSSEDGNVMIG